MSQTDQILKHLKRHPLTPLQALRQFGCLRLAARINTLRMAGHHIDTEIVERQGKRVALYRLSA